MKNRIHIKSIFWALIFSVCFIISVYALSEYFLTLPIALLIIAVNAFFFGMYTFKLIQSISNMDEVEIRIHLEAVSIAFVLSLLLIMILGMLRLAKNSGLDNLNYLYVFPLFFLFYFVGLFISKRKYR